MKHTFHFLIGVFFFCAISAGAEETVQITILQTSDSHGHIMPWDYFQAEPSDLGLATAATLIKAEKAKDPECLLLDGGDTNQGSPLMSVYLSQTPDLPNPMALVMNAMKYDAMTVGNHDFNFGQPILDRFIEEANFPVLSANIQKANGEMRFTPFIIKEVKNIKIGILGLTTNGIPVWEKPEHIAGLRFGDPIETAKNMIPKMKEAGADIIVALVHCGLEKTPVNSRDPKAWQTDPATWEAQGFNNIPNENFALALAENVPEIEVIFTGHAHMTLPELFFHQSLIVQPSSWGRGVSKVILTVSQSGQVIDKKSEFLSAKNMATQADTAIMALAESYHQKTLDDIRRPIGIATAPFTGGMEARYYDSPLADLINAIQLDMAKQAGFEADLSSTAIFNNRGHLADSIRVADVYALYPYDNTLMLIELTGNQLKAALEQSATYWISSDQTTPETPLSQRVSTHARDYNWDMITGVHYTVDLSKPVGSRIGNLTYQGKPVQPEQTFTMVLNNYRAGGGGGYAMYPECKRIWESDGTVREYLIDHIRRTRTISPENYFEKNWEIL